MEKDEIKELRQQNAALLRSNTECMKIIWDLSGRVAFLQTKLLGLWGATVGRNFLK